MNLSRHMILLMVSAALLVVVAVGAAWAVESGLGTRADAGGLPLVALGSATTGPSSSSTPTMTGAADTRLVVAQSLRMSSGPVKSGASGASGGMTTSPPTTVKRATPGATMPTGAGHDNMSSGTTMGPQSPTGTTAHMESGGMMGTTPTTTHTISPSVTPTTTYMGGTTGGMGGMTGTTGGTTGTTGTTGGMGGTTGSTGGMGGMTTH